MESPVSFSAYRTVLCLSFVMAVILIIAPTSSAASNGTGTLTWGQACNPSASLFDDQSTRCDTSKRLSCDMRTTACKCHHEERDHYNSKEDRCETKIGKFCSASETFPTICVKNAVCDSSTNFCICKQGGEPNEDGTACSLEEDDNSANLATSLKDFRVHFTLALVALGGLWL